MSMHQLNRRGWLQTGSAGMFGLAWGDLLAMRAISAPQPVSRPKSVIVLFGWGGISHLDTFDPKPDAGELSGEFKAISTQVPGLQFCEHLPQLPPDEEPLAG